MAAPNLELQRALTQLAGIVLGKERELRLCLACLLARGHLLIEDIPGVGKTTLAHALAATLGLGFKRIQFTSDLLPSDVLGVSIFDRGSSEFRLQRGPIFSHVVLADEINRAPPKAQSALLEAMEEQQVTMDGETLPLPTPFFVIATQNPFDQVGTFALPDSQLDRFLMCVNLGYPAAVFERELLAGIDRRDMLTNLAAVLDPKAVLALQQRVQRQHAAPALLDYIQALIAYSRNAVGFKQGLSPRAGIGLLRAARAWSLLEGRDMVLPEDVQAVLPPVALHRLREPADTGNSAQRLLEAVPVP
jgi:MoxR-like ATPase